MKEAVKMFRGAYGFLSNMHPAAFEWDGRVYRCSEAAFQSAKCLDPFERERFSSMNGVTAKREGKKVLLRRDWEEVKVQLMKEIVTAKFAQNPDLMQQLIATGSAELTEGNLWHDTFWGVDMKTGKGENHLGKILMEVRKELGGEAWRRQIEAEQEEQGQALQRKREALLGEIHSVEMELAALPEEKWEGRICSTKAFGQVTILRKEGDYLYFEVNGQEKTFVLPQCLKHGFLYSHDTEMEFNCLERYALQDRLRHLRKGLEMLEK